MKDFLPDGFPAELNVLCSTGPMARSLRDVELYMKVMVNSKQYLHDPRIIPFPWTGLETPVPKPIKIGLMLTDGVITPQPPVLRALEWAKSRLLKSSDFVIKPFLPYDSALAMKHIGVMYWPDVALNTKKALAATGEPIHPLTKTVLSTVTSTWDDPNGPEKEKTATELTEMRVARDEFRCAFVENWNSQDVDVVLAPCYVGPASKHDTAYYWNYTALWNFVDYPGIVIPTPIAVEEKADWKAMEKLNIVGQAEELRKHFSDKNYGATISTSTESSGSLEGVEKLPQPAKAETIREFVAAKTPYAGEWKPLSEKDEHVKAMWDEGGYEGAPINLQVVGRKYHDNQLIGIVGELQKVLGFA